MRRFSVLPLIVLVALLAVSCGGSASQSQYPEVSLGDGGMKKGPRSVENIRENVARLLPRLMYLYAEALGPDSTLRGTVLFRIEVDTKGKPGYVGVHQSTLKHEDLEDLMLAALVESRFDIWDAGKGLTEVIFAVEFTPEAALAAPKSRARRQFEQQQQLKKKLGGQPSAEEPDEWGEE